MQATSFALPDGLRERVEQIPDFRNAPPSRISSAHSQPLESEHAEITEALSNVDGSRESLVSLLTGMSRERLEGLGGF